MNTKTWIIVGILVVALIVFLWMRKKKKDDSSPKFTLEQGDRGEPVRKLQTYLNSKLAKLTIEGVAYDQIAVDGIFGPETAAACQMVFGHDYVTSEEYDAID